MINNKGRIILIGLGLLFLLNTIIGRYLVLPSYLADLEAGGGIYGRKTIVIGV